MPMIVTEFGKFRYNHIPMGICASVNTFQAKVDKFLIDIKEIKKYINGILVLSKEIFSNHI